MAYLDTTLLTEYITNEVDDETKKNGIKSGLIDFAKYNTDYQDFMTEDLVEQIKTANGRTVSVSALNHADFVVSNALSFTFNANFSVSAKTTIAVVDFWTGFHHSMASYVRNAIGYEKDLKAKYLRADKALAKAISTSIAGVLNTRRTQVLVDTIANTGESFDGVNFNLDVTLAAQKANPVFSDIVTLFNDNGIDGGEGDFSFVADSGLNTIEAYRNQYGLYNNVNLSPNPMRSFVDTTGALVRPTGTKSLGYAVRNGAISIVPSVPAEFLEGISIGGDVSKWGYGEMDLPYTKMRPLLYVKKEEFNGSAHNGSTMSMIEKHGIGVRCAIVYTYNSDLTTKANDILRVEMLTT